MNQLSNDKNNIKTENYESMPYENAEPTVKTIKDAMDQLPTELRTRHIPFWSENPNILLQQKYMFEFFPVDAMGYNQKLNAVTRTIIVLTILGFIFREICEF